jgi:3-carboxy-cis,cis-muconate cycloisomerase
MTGQLLTPLFASHEAVRLFDDRARLQGMLDFEAALARAEAKTGVIPGQAVGAIESRCRAHLFELGDLAEATAKAGNPAIPMVKRLTALVAEADKDAARFVHWGATSQDAMDTGLVLQIRVALEVIDADLDRLATGLAGLAVRHRLTPLVGRTWMQHALPVTFGLKVAGWLDAVKRHQERLAELRPRLLTLQFGGAAGTLAALGDQGLAVASALADDLGLALPNTPWHAHRDRVVEFGAWLALLTGTLGKIARDVSLLMQTDVGEVFEPAGAGKGGSSTMPHKRNPVTAASVMAAATRAPGLVATLFAAMPQEHERGLGNWHAEWVALPDLAMTAMGALRQVADMVPDLEVDVDRMRANLEVTHGLIMAERVMMALGAKLGRLHAHELVEHATRKAVAEGRHLREVLGDEPAVTAELGADELDRLFDPLGYVGQAAAFVDRVTG